MNFTILSSFLKILLPMGLILGAFVISTLSPQPLQSPNILAAILLFQSLLYLALFKTRPTLKVTLITAGIVSLIYLSIPAYFNDFWRFLWDGRLSANGINPYSQTPWDIFNSPALSQLTNVPYWDVLYFKWSNTIYPPTLQYIFLLANVLAMNAAFALKLILLAFTWGSIWLGIKLLDIFNLPRTNIAWLALHPLFLFESLAGTHLEPIIIFFVFLTILLFKQGKIFRASIIFAATILTKFFPLLLAPLFLISKTRNQKLSAFSYQLLTPVIITILAIIILYLPFAFTTDFANLTESLRAFSGEWVMSPGIFALLANFTGFSLAKTLLAAATIVVTVYQYWQYKKHGDIMQAAHNIFFWLLAFSSVVFSWYTLWIIAFLPFIKNRWPTVLLSTFIITQYALIRFDLADNTHKYFQNGEVFWHQALVWIPALTVIFLPVIYKSVTSIKQNIKKNNFHS